MKTSITSTPGVLDERLEFHTPRLCPSMGVASTAELESRTSGGVAEADFYWEQLKAVNKWELSVVWVVKAVGSRSEQECIIGDCMDKKLSSVGCAGLVSNCRVRDVPGMISIPFPGLEYEAHISLWSTDRASAEKRADVRQLMAACGFTKGVSGGKR